MLQVEDWTQPSQNQKRRPSASNAHSSSNINANTHSKRRNSHSNNAELSISHLDASVTPPNPSTETQNGSALPPTSPVTPRPSQRSQQIPVEPPQISQEADALDHFDTVRVRARTRSPPPTGPSSLSRLLAQAPSSGQEPESVPLSPNHIASPFILEPQDPEQGQVASPLPIINALPEVDTQESSSRPQSSPKNIAASPPPPSPSTGAGSLPRNAHMAGANSPSPLRSGSRASRASRRSTTSFPAVAKAKAAPTIALSGTASGTIPNASPPRSAPASRTQSPAPGEEASDGLANMASVTSGAAGNQHRRRVSSHHTPSPLSGASGVGGATATGTFANFLGFGRKKTGGTVGREDSSAAGATEILKRF